MKGLLIALIFTLCSHAQAETIYFGQNKVLGAKQFTKKLDSFQASFQFSMSYMDLEKVDDKKSQNALFSIEHKDFQKTNTVGAPERFFRSEIFVGYPKDFKISVVEGKSQFVKRSLAPVKEMPCRCEKDKNKRFDFVMDKKEYRKSQQSFVTKEYLGDFRGVPLTRVSFYPMKAWGTTGFEVFPSIAFEMKSSKRIKGVEGLAGLYDKTLNKKYLVIGPRKYREEIAPLLKRREKQGYKMSFFDLESVGKNFEQVQKFIHAQYKKEMFTYALLIGSEENFPTNYEPTSSDDQTPSDLRYFTMGGAKDDIPDVFYGRFVVSNEKDVTNQIKKIITFEERTFGNAKGINNIIGIASDEGYNPTDVEYMRSMHRPLVSKAGKKSFEFLQENRNSIPSNINSAFSSGSFWVNYIGHGSGTSWSSINNGEYHSSHIKKISKGVVLPVVIDVACQNGRFNLSNRLGERFMNETASDGTPIGAVAYYGGSVDISWHPPARMAVAINNVLVSGTYKELGKIIMAGQMDLYKNYSDKQSARENLIWYHLFGDPALQIEVK